MVFNLSHVSTFLQNSSVPQDSSNIQADFSGGPNDLD